MYNVQSEGLNDGNDYCADRVCRLREQAPPEASASANLVFPYLTTHFSYSHTDLDHLNGTVL